MRHIIYGFVGGTLLGFLWAALVLTANGGELTPSDGTTAALAVMTLWVVAVWAGFGMRFQYFVREASGVDYRLPASGVSGDEVWEVVVNALGLTVVWCVLVFGILLLAAADGRVPATGPICGFFVVVAGGGSCGWAALAGVNTWRMFLGSAMYVEPSAEDYIDDWVD